MGEENQAFGGRRGALPFILPFSASFFMLEALAHVFKARPNASIPLQRFGAWSLQVFGHRRSLPACFGSGVRKQLAELAETRGMRLQEFKATREVVPERVEVCRWRFPRLVRSRWDRGECKQVHRDERNRHEDRKAGAGQPPREVLPPGVQDALGELAGAAKEGLLALSVGVGLGVLSEMMEAELDEVVGAKHASEPERTAVRHGHEDGAVTLGGRRVAVKRPRASTADGEHEVPLGDV